MVLQTIREKTTGIIAIFILALLAIPFAFVGVNSYFSSGTENLVALVNDKEITFNEFNQSFLNYRRQAQSYLGEAFDPEMFDGPIARREHLDRMIDEALLESMADGLGLDVDDQRLVERIRSFPAFQVEGEFNRDVYQGRLLAQGMTAPQFEADMRASLIMNQVPSALAASSFATENEVAEFVALQLQTRSFDAVMVPMDLESTPAEFSDEEINAYYEDHASDFMTEEQVVIEYLELDAAFMLPADEPDEESLRARFEEQKGRFITPEQRVASHVLIEVSPEADEATRETARQEAEDIARRARDGEDFATLAAENSDDAGSSEIGGDLGWIAPGVMVEAFEDALYELSMENPISDPVQTGFGWHVIQLRDIQPASGQSFEEARMTLVQEYQDEQAERAYLDLADRVIDVIYEDPTTLEAAALDSGLEIQTAGPFGRNGGEGLAANPEVVEAAFSDLVLLQDSVSDPVDLADNHMVLLRVAEHYPVTTRPLEEVRDAIVTALREERARETAEAAATELLAEVQGGATLQTAAQARELEVQSIEAAPRGHATPDAEVVANVFRLSAPDEDGVTHAVVPATSGFAVVALNTVTDGSLEEGSLIGRQQYQRQLANAGASYEAWALRRQLRALADVQVFEDNLGVSR